MQQIETEFQDSCHSCSKSEKQSLTLYLLLQGIPEERR